MEERTYMLLFAPPMALHYVWVVILIAHQEKITSGGKTALAIILAALMGLGSWWYYGWVLSLPVATS